MCHYSFNKNEYTVRQFAALDTALTQNQVGKTFDPEVVAEKYY